MEEQELLLEILPVMVFLWGAVWGSFANVAIYRLPRGLSVVSPPSSCPKCQSPIAPWQNIPILSYLLLLGRCSKCKAPISVQYPLVELLSATLALALWQQTMFNPMVPDLWAAMTVFAIRFFFLLALVIVIFTDIQTMIIPDIVSIPATILGLCASFFLGHWTGTGPLESFLGAGLGAAFIWGLRFFYLRVRKLEALGLGDVKLLALTGAFLGYQSILFILLAGSLQGMLYAGAIYASGQRDKHKLPPELLHHEDSQAPPAFRTMAIPFGPFLSLAALQWLFFAPQIQGLLSWIFGL